MKNASLTLLSLVFYLPCSAATVIDPVSFEQIWLQNNQRNVFKRYHYYNEQVQSGLKTLYLIGIDAAPDKTIKTSAGDKEALISRMNIHYQSQNYLFLIDWFSAIPQPQDTEGFTYGDLIVGRTWHYQSNNSYLTLGLRQVSRPRSIVVNSERVFNATNDASEETYSVFFHYNYHGYDLGTYYSEDNQLDAVDFYIPISRSENQSISSTIYYYSSNPEADLSSRYEVSLDHALVHKEHSFRSGAIVTFLQDTDTSYVSNVFTNYTSPAFSGVRLVAGAYYSDIENEQSLAGAKLGLIWNTGSRENIQLSFSVQKNAIGDFNALIIRDEPILTFTVSSEIYN